jgi:hypothetical protein
VFLFELDALNSDSNDFDGQNSSPHESFQMPGQRTHSRANVVMQGEEETEDLKLEGDNSGELPFLICWIVLLLSFTLGVKIILINGQIGIWVFNLLYSRL